jgi:hypothetical protein
MTTANSPKAGEPQGHRQRKSYFTTHALDLFAIRCCQLADDVTANRIAFLDAIDVAYDAAVASGLVRAVGDDAAQKVMACAFAEVGRKRAA